VLSANKPEFTDTPVCNLDIGGRALLELQTVVAHECGITDITVVAGFKQEECVSDRVTKYVNDRWEQTGSCGSLKVALDGLKEDDDLVIMYGDTICVPGLLKQVMDSGHDLAVCCVAGVSEGYREYCTVEDGALAGIDSEYQQGQSVFTGIFLVRKNRIGLVKGLLEDELSLGGLVNQVVHQGEEVQAHVAGHGWHELNSQKAFQGLKNNTEFIRKLMLVHNDWARRAEKYNLLDWVNRDVLTRGMLEAADGIRPARALDIGTGTGKVMKAVKARYPQCECWGIDNNEAMIGLIEDRKSYTIRICDVADLNGIRDAYFDLVTARMVFHHIDDPAPALSEIRRVLKPGGIFILCEGNPPTERSVDWYTQMFSYKEERITLTEADLINLFEKAGFSDVTTKIVMMEDCSLNNWLANSGLPEENIEIIRRLHYEAPDDIQEDYRMEFRDNDCFMDWKFSIVSGRNES